MIHVKNIERDRVCEEGGVCTMSKDEIAALADIEESQAALRKSIESAKELSRESERLIRQFRGKDDCEGAD